MMISTEVLGFLYSVEQTRLRGCPAARLIAVCQHKLNNHVLSPFERAEIEAKIKMLRTEA